MIILITLVLLLSLCIEVKKEEPQMMKGQLIKVFNDNFIRDVRSYGTSVKGGIIAYPKDGIDQAEVALFNITTMEEKTIYTILSPDHPYVSFRIPFVELNRNGVVWCELKTSHVRGSENNTMWIEEERACYFYNLTTNKKEILHKVSSSGALFLDYWSDKIAWRELHHNNSGWPPESLVYLYDLATKEKKSIPSLSSPSVYLIGIYKDVIVFGDAELGIIGKYYINDGKIEKIMDLKNGTEKSALNFLDGTLFYTIEGKNAVWGYNIENDTNFLIYESPTLENVSQDIFSFNTVVWDGDMLAWVNEDGIHVCNIKSKEERCILGLSDIKSLFEGGRGDDARGYIKWLRIYDDKLIMSVLGDLYVYILPEGIL